ncbi:YdiU family protein [Aphanothece hegewaldii CCALA 016]|uniref:Protein nucleotidyltransferase YdiU n=1 Tax=Aphanothece hegewaldii CCALA 016 TaxID=2107694 RepID=A0A2T1M293_9CHRO|nr:YdiU family protein [Aphanothece hegewaldii]PSF38875.1 YdiU family protein [Aphanothece hegewaldii CCALA 016]
MSDRFLNPFFNLEYVPAIEDLGDDYYDQVSAADFPEYILRFRNDRILPLLGLSRQSVEDEYFIEAFGHFPHNKCLALRYHGYQFGEYNPYLGDGRGFLYGQVRGIDGRLYDFGTKGSGRTPYSRTADGRLTLKGGVREVLAAEALHYLGVNTSRCLSLIETGEALWRGDEPSPTRSSVMVRFSQSHIRFGTFERLRYFKRSDLIQKLLDHVIDYYYPEIQIGENRYAEFYASLVERVAKLTAQWMAAGFCHGVLNTDNMSITGESFDYGPYGFIPTYNPNFIAAYFDYGGRYSYGNQPLICRLNLEMLQVPLSMVISYLDLDAGLAKFEEYYDRYYIQLMMNKLGFHQVHFPETKEFVYKTIELLQETQLGYHDFFASLGENFNDGWRKESSLILENLELPLANWTTWKQLYHQILQQLPIDEMEQIRYRLQHYNPKTALLRPVIESVWEPITNENNWEPFNQLVQKIQAKE